MGGGLAEEGKSYDSWLFRHCMAMKMRACLNLISDNIGNRFQNTVRGESRMNLHWLDVTGKKGASILNPL